jgi:hypothetical protein
MPNKLVTLSQCWASPSRASILALPRWVATAVAVVVAADGVAEADIEEEGVASLLLTLRRWVEADGKHDLDHRLVELQAWRNTQHWNNDKCATTNLDTT